MDESARFILLKFPDFDETCFSKITFHPTASPRGIDTVPRLLQVELDHRVHVLDHSLILPFYSRPHDAREIY